MADAVQKDVRLIMIWLNKLHHRIKQIGVQPLSSQSRLALYLSRPSSVQKRLNVDSPSFTPASLSVNGSSLPSKTKGLSPKAASAAPFQPKGTTPGNHFWLNYVVLEIDAQPAAVAPSSSASMKQYNPKAPDWVAPEVQEFLPQTYSTIATVS